MDDSEGIHSHEQYFGELTLMYLPKFEPETGVKDVTPYTLCE